MKQKIKNFLKKNAFLNNIFISIKSLEFRKDKKFFINNYMYSLPITKDKLEYDMLFEIHKLEKGFAAQKPRPFGIDKVKRIIRNINEFEKNNYDKNSFAYNLSLSLLSEYLNFYDEKCWTDKEEYEIVKEFMCNERQYTKLPVGAYEYVKKDFIKDAMIDYNKFVSSRRSIRNFSSKKLSEDDISKAVNMAIKTPTACNRQMCKIYYVNSSKKRKIVEEYAQGLSLFDLTNANYFIVTFDVSANYFVGERNQGWFNSGLVTMNFINALHSLGIGSCCIQFGNSFKQEQEFKRLLNIPNNERIGVILTAGYYDEISKIPYSTRKPIEEIYRQF